MDKIQSSRRAFLLSLAAIGIVKIQQVPMPSGVPSHWIEVAFRFLPFKFFMLR
jgi:hypothetical protein